MIDILKDKKLLVVLHIPLYPAHRGDNRRIESICRMFTEHCAQIDLIELIHSRANIGAKNNLHYFSNVIDVLHPVFLPEEVGIFDRLNDIDMDSGLDEGLYSMELAPFNFQNEIRKNLWIKDYDAVVVFSSECLPLVIPAPINTRLIYIPCDVQHTLRERIKEAGIMLGKNSSLIKSQEISCFRYCDLIATVSENDAKAIKKYCSCPVVPLRTECEAIHESVSPSNADTGIIFFVGSGSEINIDAIRRFLKNIWPLVLKGYPGAQLFIAGEVCQYINVEHPNVKLFGRVKDLTSLYARAQVVISPIAVSAGIFVKNLEAMAYGKALVTTEAGNFGLEIPNDIIRVVRNDCEFADVVVKLLQDPVKSAALGVAARNYIKVFFNKHVVFRDFLDILVKLFSDSSDLNCSAKTTLFFSKDASSSEDKDFAIYKLETHLKAAQSSGWRKIMLYGAGKHTRRLLSKARWGSLLPVAIIDDAPNVESIKNVPVIKPCDVLDFANDIDGIIISSNSYEEEMTIKAKDFTKGTNIKILKIYGK